MDGDHGPWVVYSAIALAIVGSGLIARRIPWRRALGYSAAWIGIFGAVYGLSLFRGDFAELARRASSDLTGPGEPLVSGSRTIIEQANDGHFWVDGRVGDQPVRFLIDSGASVTAIDTATAAKLGLTVDRTRLPTIVQTANGPIRAWPATVDRVRVGSIDVAGLAVLVSDTPQDVNLLGMNWLSQLKSWSVRGGVMTLEP